MTTKGSTTTAFMMGALAGGVAALLLAPQTGEQLRRRLRSGAEELQTASDKLKHNARDKAESVTGAVKNAVTDAKNTYRDEVDRRHQSSTVDAVARKTGA